MDQFYTIVIAVAFGILLLCLIAVGIMMQNQDKDKAYPNYASKCPDGWVSDLSGCTIPASTHANFPKDHAQLSNAEVYNKSGGLYNNASLTNVSANNVGQSLLFNEAASTCDKKSWADAVGCSWDGVSNYNKC